MINLYNKIMDVTKILLKADSFVLRVIKSGSVLTAGGFLDNLFRFARNIILAKLLAPDAFGIMATIMASVSVIEAFTEVGLKQSVIQHKSGAEEEFLSIIWWLSTLRACCLYAIAFLAAPWIDDFYTQYELTTLLRTGFLVILFNGITSPRFYILEKEIRFFNSVLLTNSAGLIGVLSSLILALLFESVWALLIGYLIEYFLRFLFSFIFYPTVIRLHINRNYLSDILGFSRGIFGLPILMMLFINAPVFIIGKIISFEILGMYSLAYDMADIPNKVLARINPLILSAFSAIQEETDRLRETILMVTKYLITFTLPLVAVFIIFAEPILMTAYEPRYSAVAIPFSILCLFMPLQMCSQIIMNLLFAIGRPNLHRTASFARTGLFLVLVYPATKYFGLIGLASSMVAAAVVLLLVQMIYLQKILSIQIGDYFMRWKPGIKLTLYSVIIPGLILNTLFSISGIYAVMTGLFLCLLAWVQAAFQLYYGEGIASIYLKETSNQRQN
jgi:lipopolysaccharide exporter